MNIFLIIVIALLIIMFALYAFWLKLLKGKPGRVAGADVEKKTFEEALVVDVRWRKEYARGHAINAVNLPIKLFKNGSDVLDEQDNTSYEMLDLKTGQCQFILASLEGYNPKEGRRQRIGTKYPTITKQYFGSQDVEIIKIEGSVELAPLVGLADAIVDITETGTTLRENNLKIYDWLQPISTRLVANPLALKQKRNTIFALIDQLQSAIDKK